MTIRKKSTTKLTTPTAAMLKNQATERAFDTFLRTAGRQATRANNDELARKKAIGATIDTWIASLDEKARAGFFRSIEAVATTANARRIATHPDRPEWLDEEAGEGNKSKVAGPRDAASDLVAPTE